MSKREQRILLMIEQDLQADQVLDRELREPKLRRTPRAFGVPAFGRALRRFALWSGSSRPPGAG
ncbi:MAG: hypothetical protein HOV94_36810 [Saccharothrix sp.]|nr:hypothetical protein [Saccharothrix sp.]